MKNRLKIAITGPESSGKTTVAKLLTEELNGFFVPEFARDYLEKLDRPYTIDDLDLIAEGQITLWNDAPKDQTIICDTELIVLKIWSEFKYGTVSTIILDKLNSQSFDHYFLCQPDFPWAFDELRENPNDQNELFDLYLEELKNRKFPFTILSGSLENRVEDAISELRKNPRDSIN